MSVRVEEPVQAGAPEAAQRRRLSLPKDVLGVWEIALAVLVVLTVVIASAISPFFLSGNNFSITAAATVGIALMVVPMTWLMIAGEIDLSVASIFGLSGVVFGMALEHGVALPLAMVIGLAVGGVAGLINGLLAIDIGLPSLIVTVGTLGLYRGLAYVLLENRGISDLPESFTTFAQGNLPGLIIPNGFALFVVFAVVAAILLHRGSIGRQVLAVGSNPKVSMFSGVRVKRVKRNLFIFSGLVASLAGMLYSGYINSVRATNGTGLELIVIGIVLIGGVSMYGGKGSFVGVLLSLTLVTALTSSMTLSFVATNIQYMVTGLLMIGAVVVPVVVRRLTNLRRPS